MQSVRYLVSGFLMGTADLVPGVSGGTIALVLGIYERLVRSIREASSAIGWSLRANFQLAGQHLRHVEWGVLLGILAGIIAAILLLASYLETQLEENPTILAGLFLGLVAGSVSIGWNRISKPNGVQWLISALVGAGIFAALGFGEGVETADPTLLAFFGSGALAICAMILPGISGSLILLLLGMYEPVLAAVNDRAFVTVAVFAVGAIVGLALFSQMLNWALSNFRDPVMAALVGLMAGSTRVLWPWPDGVESAQLGTPRSDWVPVTIAAWIGVAAVHLISRTATERAGEQPS